MLSTKSTTPIQTTYDILNDEHMELLLKPGTEGIGVKSVYPTLHGGNRALVTVNGHVADLQIGPMPTKFTVQATAFPKGQKNTNKPFAVTTEEHLNDENFNPNDFQIVCSLTMDLEDGPVGQEIKSRLQKLQDHLIENCPVELWCAKHRDKILQGSSSKSDYFTTAANSTVKDPKYGAQSLLRFNVPLVQNSNEFNVRVFMHRKKHETGENVLMSLNKPTVIPPGSEVIVLANLSVYQVAQNEPGIKFNVTQIVVLSVPEDTKNKPRFVGLGDTVVVDESESSENVNVADSTTNTTTTQNNNADPLPASSSDTTEALGKRQKFETDVEEQQQQTDEEEEQKNDQKKLRTSTLELNVDEQHHDGEYDNGDDDDEFDENGEKLM